MGRQKPDEQADDHRQRGRASGDVRPVRTSYHADGEVTVRLQRAGSRVRGRRVSDHHR
jgi:hypothetical protein